MKVSIIVPIYKSSVNKEEASSLKQLLNILGQYQIIFITHKELDLSAYNEICRPNKIKVSYFPKQSFGGIWAYNKLMISKDFYSRFSTSEFILIYQLDAWVFKDELVYWCEQGFDYIGAPLYDGFGSANKESHFFGIGNGGFSLRKVSSYLKVLSSFKFISTFQEYKQANRNNLDIESKNTIRLFIEYLTRHNTLAPLNGYNHNEDTFWGELIPKKFPWFKIPDELTAARFSMEVKAPYLYQLNHQTLPFGCHAWEKYHTDFWAKHIKVIE